MKITYCDFCGAEIPEATPVNTVTLADHRVTVGDASLECCDTCLASIWSFVQGRIRRQVGGPPQSSTEGDDLDKASSPGAESDNLKVPSPFPRKVRWWLWR